MQKHLPFVKMSGAGNDFIAIAEQDLPEVGPGWLAGRLCARAMSVGADGLIVVSPAEDAAVRIRFYNPDGSVAEMCGNGSRCAARYAVDNGLVSGPKFKLLTDSGDLAVEQAGDGLYRVVMPQPARTMLDFLNWEDDGQELTVDAVQVGVPHCVVRISGLDEADDERLIRIGRSLRHHEQFPNGVNVNFVEQRQDGMVRQRTYERGVENLTKACGTGATAIAAVLMTRGAIDPPVDLIADGGRLRITVENNEYWLAGDARLIATGIVTPEAAEWSGLD